MESSADVENDGILTRPANISETNNLHTLNDSTLTSNAIDMEPTKAHEFDCKCRLVITMVMYMSTKRLPWRCLTFSPMTTMIDFENRLASLFDFDKYAFNVNGRRKQMGYSFLY